MKGKRIFISSTFTDLIPFREAVQKSVRQAGGIDVSMENFGARDNRPLAECQRVIKEETDVFVGIYAHRYGFVPDGYRLSITELEYNAACETKIPVLIFVIEEDEPWPKKYIDFGESEEKLLLFKERIGREKIWSRFTNKDHLAASVVSSLIRELDYRGIKSIEDAGQSAISRSFNWINHRKKVYGDKREIFLTHILKKSSIPNQDFDIFIYLIKHKNEGIGIPEVDYVEFFFGDSWDNKVYKVPNEGGYIGINLSAFGTFLCTSRITFRDGKQIYLERYIDFEQMK